VLGAGAGVGWRVKQKMARSYGTGECAAVLGGYIHMEAALLGYLSHSTACVCLCVSVCACICASLYMSTSGASIYQSSAARRATTSAKWIRLCKTQRPAMRCHFFAP
jgi:hypothetical protein